MHRLYFSILYALIKETFQIFHDNRLLSSVSSLASSSRKPREARRCCTGTAPFSLPVGADAAEISEPPDSEDRRSEGRRSLETCAE
jgi:hypothetical protein